MKRATLFFCLVFPTVANAADVSIKCKAKQVDANGAEISGDIRFDISLEPRYYKAEVDVGPGFRPWREGKLAAITDTRFTIKDEPDHKIYIDRVSGQFYSKDTEGTIIRGNCEKAPSKGNKDVKF